MSLARPTSTPMGSGARAIWRSCTRRRPSLTPLDDQTGNQDIALTPYQFAANAFEGPGLVYSAALSSGAALPAWLVFDPVTRTFSGAPTEIGTFTIRVTAREPVSSLKVSDDFDWVVAA